MTAPTLAPSTLTDEPLSVHLRTATRTQHEQAEGTSFIGRLMAGELDLAAYADLAAQHHTIYTALEDAERFVRADAAGATIVFDELPRVAALEAEEIELPGPSSMGRALIDDWYGRSAQR